MTTVKPFANNTLTVYKYEPFSYTISNPYAPSPTTTTVSTGIPPSLVVTTTSNVVFSSSGYNGGTSSNESIVIDVSSGFAYSSNTVIINPGRFRDSNGDSISNTAFTFYKNEAIPSAVFEASIALQTPLLTFPALPAGLTLTKTASNQFTLAGTPTVQIPTSNYQIIGQGSNSDAGKIVTTVSSITVNGERLRLALTGSPIVDHMVVGSAISQRKVSASFPLASGSNLRYTWDPLPDGLYFGDLAGVPKSSGFQPVDASYTLTVQGTPTISAAKAFAAAGIDGYTANVQALRLTAPTISNSTFYTFQFDRMILFDDVSIPTFYTDISLNPTQTFFFAKTYFGSDASISEIFSPDLRGDLSLSFVSNQARAYLTGKPLTAGTGSYTIRASNTLGDTRDLSVTIPVSNSSLTIDYSVTPAIDTCFSYILSRPSSSFKPGYYPASVQIKVTPVPSSLPVTFSTSDLVGTGLSLSSISPSAVQITGTPDTITALKTVTITATAVDTPATASTTLKLAVLDDVITLSTPPASSFAFVQNREITPIQIQAVASLSERPITSFSSLGLPSGLGISPGGLITGTPSSDTSGTAVITATTGYASGSNSYPFALTPDSILMQVTPAVQTYLPGASLTIPIKSGAYSGITPSNFAFSPLTPTYGLTVGSSTGIITGPLTDSIPPNDLLPTSNIFAVTARAGVLDASLSIILTTQNPVVDRRFLFRQTVSEGSRVYITDTSSLAAWTLVTEFPNTRWFTDFQSKNATVDANAYLLCDTNGQSIYRTLTGVNFEKVVFQGANFGSNDFPYTVRYQATSGRWYAAGTTLYTDPDTASTVENGVSLYSSTDDGASWSSLTPGGLPMVSRQYSELLNYYTFRGVTLAVANGVIMLGGGYDSVRLPSAPTLLRSTNGTVWETPANAFIVETGSINTDGPVWVMTGSDSNSSGSNSGTLANCSTIRWSEDEGHSWDKGSGVLPQLIGRDLAYASNTWIATGLTFDTPSYTKTMIVCSTDGKEWSEVVLPETLTSQLIVPLVDYRIEAASPWSDGSNWNIVVKRQKDGAPTDYTCKIYTHPLTGDLTTGWTVRASSITPFDGDTMPMTLTGYSQHYIRTGVPTVSTFTFVQLSGAGPIVTAPAEAATFIAYQYIPIDPVQLSGTGTGIVYFFILAVDLPQGLVFDPLTNRISGTSVKLGTVTVTGYAKDDVGITKFTVTFETILPSVLRVQSNASSYTALLRQYTIVNATQNARDNRVLPAGDRLLGEFTAPVGPDVITQTVDPRCTNPECK